MYDYMPCWVIEHLLARSARPGRALGSHAEVPRAVVDEWLQILREMGIKSILCLLDEEHLRLYRDLPQGLLGYYRNWGFDVAHLPVRDPAHHPNGQKILKESLEEAWRAFQSLPKPVLVHCSAGIDRTGRVVEHILRRLDEKRLGGSGDAG